MTSRILKYLLALTIVFPFVFLAMLSVGQQWRFPALIPQDWSLDNWVIAWQMQDGLGSSLVLSLSISLVLATFSTVLSFFISRQIAGSSWRKPMLTSSYFPYVFAPVILGACLQYYFIRSGLSGNILGVMIAQLFICFPYGVIFFVSFWNERLVNMQNLVSTLGGNRFQAYRLVLLPIAKGAIMTCFFQLFLISWFEYGLTSLIGVGKVQTLPIRVFQYVNEANTFFAALASCLLVLPPLVLLWFNRRFVFGSVS